MIFYLRFLCALCAGRLVVTIELCIVVSHGVRHRVARGAMATPPKESTGGPVMHLTPQILGKFCYVHNQCTVCFLEKKQWNACIVVYNVHCTMLFCSGSQTFLVSVITH